MKFMEILCVQLWTANCLFAVSMLFSDVQATYVGHKKTSLQ